MSQLEDDGSRSSDFIAIEEDDQQALWVGVRPVYSGAVKSNQPVVQIEYQHKWQGSDLQGPVFLSPQTWRDLNRAVEWRLRTYEPWYTRVWRRLSGHRKDN